MAKNAFIASGRPCVSMMEAADARQRDNLTGARRFDRAHDRRVAVERHVRAVRVVVSDVLADQAKQVPFAEHDHVVEQLAAQRPHESFRVPVLPR